MASSGRGVTVQNIGVIYENDPDVQWIAQNLELTLAEVHAALAYFYENREAFEESIQEGIDLAEQLGMPISSFLSIEDGAWPSDAIRAYTIPFPLAKGDVNYGNKEVGHKVSESTKAVS